MGAVLYDILRFRIQLANAALMLACLDWQLFTVLSAAVDFVSDFCA